MLKSSKIKFESGSILTANMLENLQTFSLRDIEINYYNYSSGIIKGLDFENDENYLYLTPGFLKYDGEYYFLEKKERIMNFSENFEEKNKNIYIYLMEDESEKIDSITIKKLRVQLSNKEEKGIFLGYFSHHKGEKISTKYKELRNIKDNPGNYINIINRKYAGREGATLSPEIIYLYAKELLEKQLLNHMDNYIFSKGLNREIVEIDILKKYLNLDGDDFQEIYNKLVEYSENRFKIEEKKVIEKQEKKSGFSVE